MMSNNLKREQRPDKNGKIVTRLVKVDQLTGKAKTALPAPAASTQPSSTKKFKPRVKQLAQERRTGVWRMNPTSEELISTGNVEVDDYFAFTANDVEIYGVMAATSRYGDAIKLLMEGVRSEDEARDYFSRYGLDHLAADNTEFAQEALRKNVDTDIFAKHMQNFEPHHDPSNAVDAAVFDSSPLGDGHKLIREDILEGSISYDHIKRIGVPKLKAYGRLAVIREPLKKLQSGEADYTVDDLKDVMARIAFERLESQYLDEIMGLMEVAGPKFVKNTGSLYRASSCYTGFLSDARYGRLKEDTVTDLTVYTLTVTDLAAPDSGGYLVVTEHFEAGIPPEVTAEVILKADGSVERAKAIMEARDKGIATSIEEGWL